MKRAYVDISEGQMHYRYAGQGTNNIILLHMSGSSSDEFEETGNLLAERGFHVFAIDLLGFGGSDVPSHYYYAMDEHVQTIVEFMDALDIASSYFYGNMATANMAAHIGIKYPHRVKGLMLAHPLGSPIPAQYAQKRDLPVYQVVEAKSDGSHMAELWTRSNKYGAAADICDARCRCLHMAGKWGETLHWALFEDSPLANLLPKLSVPTVIAAYEAFGNLEFLQSMTKLLSLGYFDVYARGTPYISRSDPEMVVQMITKFFPFH